MYYKSHGQEVEEIGGQGRWGESALKELDKKIKSHSTGLGVIPRSSDNCSPRGRPPLEEVGKELLRIELVT